MCYSVSRWRLAAAGLHAFGHHYYIIRAVFPATLIFIKYCIHYITRHYRPKSLSSQSFVHYMLEEILIPGMPLLHAVIYSQSASGLCVGFHFRRGVSAYFQDHIVSRAHGRSHFAIATADDGILR